jgi:putative pyruvate formate lyase activating enzyme
MDRNSFVLERKHFEPAYLRSWREDILQERASIALESLAHCKVCPRHCGVNRLHDETAVCHSGRFARVASYHPHHGEEDCLRGWHGSGTIFFGVCNLRCVFCQNYEISQGPYWGEAVRAEQLADIMLCLQAQGCHNINLVTPEHVVPQLLEALVLAVEDGLRLPLVYNSSAYDSLHSLRLLDGVVDIYMPDFKCWNKKAARRYLKAHDYPEMARAALREMQRQVGVLRVDEDGLALRGLLVRHLVMPYGGADSAAILAYLAQSLSCDTYVNLMGQYFPSGKVSADSNQELNRRVSRAEYDAVMNAGLKRGLWRFDRRVS